MRIVITGTNRGIGLEFVRQYLARGDHIDTGIRHPEKATALTELAKSSDGRLRIFPCDIADDTSVRTFAEAVGDIAVDLLINNAGVSGEMVGFFSADLEKALRTYDTNTLGTVRMIRSFLPHLRRSSMRKIVNLSSSVASIANMSDDMFFGYRMTKTALNMATKVASTALREEGFTVLAMDPGWVRTDMGGEMAPITPEESVRGMIPQIEGQGHDASGSFLDFTGQTIPW